MFDWNTAILGAIILLHLIYDIAINRINKQKILSLKGTIEQQQSTVNLIKDFVSLISIEEFTKRMQMKLDNLEEEHKKILEEALTNRHKELTDLLSSILSIFFEHPEFFKQLSSDDYKKVHHGIKRLNEIRNIKP